MLGKVEEKEKSREKLRERQARKGSFMEKSEGDLAQRRVIAKKISQATNSLFSSLIDFTLYSLLFLPAASFGKRATSRGVYQTFQEANELLEEINYQSFKNALRKLREKGWLESFKDWQNKKIATKEGQERLKAILPTYKEKRFWDGNLYIFQYDIPVPQNKIRDSLRRFLKKLGGIKLQESSYLTFYNPQELTQEFLKQHPDFNGNILLSKLTKDGILGDEDISDFIWSRSGLAEVNERYKDFINKYKKANEAPQAHAYDIFKDGGAKSAEAEKHSSPIKSGFSAKADKISKNKMMIDYFSILQDDPQIPFELLPDEYLGDEAYLLVLQRFKNTLFHAYVRSK